MLKLKNSVGLVKRVPHFISKRKGMYTMERNERVDDFEKKTLNKIFKSINSFDLRTYPTLDNIYLKLANWLGVKEENLLLTEGADGGLLKIFSTYMEPKSRFLTLTPGFLMYPVYCSMFKSKCYEINLNENSQKNYFENLKKEIKLKKPNILAIANPNQPMEVFLSKKQLEEICKLTKKINCLFVLDEAYYHFNNLTGIKLIKKFKNLIIVRTFSKAFGLAGIRAGYLVSNKKIIDDIKSIKPIYEINGINVKIIDYFLKNLDIMKRYVSEVSKSRKIIKEKLKKFNVETFGDKSNTVMLKFLKINDARPIHKKLLKSKFLTKPVMVDSNNNYLRVTLGSTKITSKFINTLISIVK
jgi:histidinol-phosphate aminotransferase